MDFFKKATESLGGSGGEAALLEQAQGFLGSPNPAPTTDAPATTSPDALSAATTPPPAPPAGSENSASYAEVYSNAQTLYQGLQEKLGGKQSTVDDQQLASAASNVLKVAEQSGFAKDSQYADYFNKAETYLDKYGQPQAPAAPTSAPVAPTSEPDASASAPPPAQ